VAALRELILACDLSHRSSIYILRCLRVQHSGSHPSQRAVGDANCSPLFPPFNCNRYIDLNYRVINNQFASRPPIQLTVHSRAIETAVATMVGARVCLWSIWPNRPPEHVI